MGRPRSSKQQFRSRQARCRCTPRGGGWLLVALLLGTPAAGQPPPSAAVGAQLFAGSVAFQNGGPACATCHSIGGLAFPNGGTMGPDLTHTVARFGDAGIDAMLQTLFFPTMQPIFDAHPLTPAEQANLKAFFQTAQNRPPAPNITPLLLLIACGGGGIWLVVAHLTWRRRLGGVRRTLVATATRKAHLAS